MKSHQAKQGAWTAGISALVFLLASPGCGNDSPPAAGAASKVDTTATLDVPKEKGRNGALGQPDMSPRELRDLKRKAAAGK
jgi:hypothetical protein